MTEQRRREIRAELARRMGWTIIEMRLGHFCLIAPDGRYKDCFHSEPEDVWYCGRLPDPFTNAEDKDALVKWICSDKSPASFDDDVFLSEISKIYGQLETPHSKRELACAIWEALNASREAITLAAAKALDIGVVEDE